MTTTDRSLQPTVFWRLAEGIPPGLSWLLMALSVLVPLLAWFLLSNAGVISPRFLPTPQMVVTALGRLWQQGYLGQDTFASFFRVMVGFLLAGLVAIPVGIAMGAFASIRALFEPIIGIVRYMPAPAFIPLLIIYLGLGETPKVALIFIGTVFYNILMIMDAVKFVPKDLIESTYTLGGNRRQVLFQVIVPYVVPNMLDTFRINVATSWNLVVVAELVAAEVGLGKRIAIAQKFFQTDEIFACLLVLGVIGFLLDLSLRLLLQTTCRWAID
ncbi:ABC-type nitrate/sulfonate/bicarbonate transport system, permease component [Halomicronema hongdechloris C2206]|uniref:ABC-type nitrate/sulfonate/bicarbonate transport system, permease component n=1 Tax=Halomicronema hongdechloris C2206 TaxID=1641165 RepID=A0A1Z3HLC4_9CYAN|nr:ABC transporter permease [Halomicronema hongdechloris]ASC71076.1 ABC-type nitrate/sulfonate/bicarbonate transport system, permease component [Halomicronema hongdechloris C2206]